MIAIRKKKFKISIPARASFWYTASSLMERGTTVLFTPIFTRLLIPSEYGIYSLYISWLGVFTVIASLELTGSVIYRGLAKFKSEKECFISAALGLLSLSAIISLTLYILFGRILNDITGLGTEITLLLLLQIFLTGIQNLYSAKCKFLYKYKTTSSISLALAISSPTLSVLLIRVTHLGGVSRIIAPLAISLVISLPLFFIIVKEGRKLFNRNMWLFILKFNLPLIPHLLALSAIAQSGKIIVGRMLGGEALGRYSVAFSAGFIVSLATYGIHSALQPWITRKLLANEEKRINPTAQALFSLAVISTLMFFCILPEVFAFFASGEYYESIGAVYPIAISVVISFLSNTVATAITYYEKNYLVTLSSVSVAGLAIALNLMSVARYGYISAAIIQLSSALLLCLLNYFTLRWVLKKNLFLPKEYLKYIIFILLFTLLLFLFREVFLSRILIFTVLLMIMLPLLQKCKELIREK